MQAVREFRHECLGRQSEKSFPSRFFDARFAVRDLQQLGHVGQALDSEHRFGFQETAQMLLQEQH